MKYRQPAQITNRAVDTWSVMCPPTYFAIRSY